MFFPSPCPATRFHRRRALDGLVVPQLCMFIYSEVKGIIAFAIALGSGRFHSLDYIFSQKYGDFQSQLVLLFVGFRVGDCSGGDGIVTHFHSKGTKNAFIAAESKA